MQVINHKQLLDSLYQLFDEQKDASNQITVNDDFRHALSKTIQSSHLTEEVAETKNVSILLSDLRGFTAMAEKYSPLTVIALLNRYFSKMSKIIDRHGGMIDKFMGDSIMVLFGARPCDASDLPTILTCAIEMQIAMNEINAISESLGMAHLYMGIGINTGEVVAGTLGSDVYREYTVIGDQVNLVSRVEAQSLRGQILISENTFELGKDFIEIGDVNEVHVKGKSHAVKMYELMAINNPNRLEVPCREIRSSPRVEVNIPLHFYLLEGKRVLDTVYEGSVIDISYGGLFAHTKFKLETFAEIKMNVSLSLMGSGTSEIYARVLHCRQIDSSYEIHLEFTAIDDDARLAIKAYVDKLL
ncbi:MAG: adenylate cyclase [Gammaproteobacteria bacterium]|nr:MAG: adenylate cyclase [Gammaproteobacteria bacterium]